MSEKERKKKKREKAERKEKEERKKAEKEKEKGREGNEKRKKKRGKKKRDSNFVHHLLFYGTKLFSFSCLLRVISKSELNEDRKERKK